MFDGIYPLTFLNHICKILTNVGLLEGLIEGINEIMHGQYLTQHLAHSKGPINVIYCRCTMGISPRGREDLRPLAMAASFIPKKNPNQMPLLQSPLCPSCHRAESFFLSKGNMSPILGQSCNWTKRILDNPKSLFSVNNS